MDASGNVLQTLLHGEPPRDVTKAKDFIDKMLSIVTHAMHTGIHTTLGSSPGNLVFNREMFLNIPLIADWHAITRKREHLINENLMGENGKQKCYGYVPNTCSPRSKSLSLNTCSPRSKSLSLNIE